MAPKKQGVETPLSEMVETYKEETGQANDSVMQNLPDLGAEAIDFTAQEGIDAQLSEISRKTSADLKKCRQVKVRIPPAPLNPDTPDATVGINGLNILIQRNVNVMLPEPVYVLLVNGGYNPIYVP